MPTRLWGNPYKDDQENSFAVNCRYYIPWVFHLSDEAGECYLANECVADVHQSDDN